MADQTQARTQRYSAQISVSAMTTIVKLTSQNSSSNALPDVSISSERHVPFPSPSAYLQTQQTPTPIISGTDSIPHPPTSQGSTSISSGSTSSLSKIPSPILKTPKSNPTSIIPQLQSQPQPQSQLVNVDQKDFRHQKTESTASIRPRLVAKGAQSFNQQNQYLTMVTKEDSSSAHDKLSDDKEMARMSALSFSMNRQDDGRLQLEQEREFQRARKFRMWTRSKVVLLLANTLLLIYSVGWTAVMTMSWMGSSWTKPYLDSGIMIIANRRLLYLMMIAAPSGIFIALLGYVGILVQNRKVLSIYAILLWPLFGIITSIGYISFRQSHSSLYQRLKFSWINEYTRDDRLVIQNALSCCGYRSPGDYPSYDLHCFPRAPLPSCEVLFYSYQQELLSNTSSAAFSTLVAQLLVMIVALLCSNHIDNLYRTANPITPKLYTQ